MSDREMQAGIRTFFSGGAAILDSEMLKRIVICASGVLVSRGEKAPLTTTTHLIVNQQLVCGVSLLQPYRHKNDKTKVISADDYYYQNYVYTDPDDWEPVPFSDEDERVTSHVNEVTCLSCKKTQSYKALTGSNFVGQPAIIHYTADNQAVVSLISSNHYYTPVCRKNSFDGVGDRFPSTVISRDPEKVTCGNCRKTKTFKELIGC